MYFRVILGLYRVHIGGFIQLRVIQGLHGAHIGHVSANPESHPFLIRGGSDSR